VLTPTVVIGRPVRLQVSAAAFSAGKVARKPMKVVLQLLVGGRPLAASEQEVSLEAPAVAQFSFVPEKPEDIVARVGLTGGPFGPGADDVRYCTVRVRSPIRVLVAAGGNVGRYVVTALDPYGEPSRSGIDVRAVGPGDLGEAVASGTPDLVVLANCPGLDESARQALAMLASSGGGILVFLGDAADTGYVANELVPRVVGDRSLTFGPMEGAPPGAPFGLTEIDTARPPLQAFANPRAGDLGALRFAKARKINVGDEARVLAAYDNGSPALLEWRAGAGRLMLFNTSADGSWGEHIRSPAYVPLMHRLAGYLARPGRPSIADVVVGEKPAIARAAPPPTEVRLQSPGGEEQTVPVQDGMLSEVKVPGEYPVRCGDLDLAFAANVDPRESDLTRTDRAFVEKALAPAKVTFLPPSAVAEEFRAALPASTELSVPLLLLALAAVLVESVLSIIRRGPEEGAGKARASAV